MAKQISSIGGLSIALGLSFIAIGAFAAMTCTMSMPPQCGGLPAASPFLAIALILFIYAYYDRENDSENEGD